MQMTKSMGVIRSLIVLFSLVSPVSAADPAPIRIGLNADMSSADAESGEAIRRGALVAMEEINAAGGVLGRPLALEVRDHRRNPARGVVNMREFAAQEEVVAVLGGKHTPVILAELEVVHEHGIPYLIPWAAGTQLVDNGHDPNFVFRVSVRDEYAGVFLVDHILERDFERVGLILEQTGWGRSNELALTLALREHGLSPARVEWFNWGERSFAPALARLEEAKADALVFVGNAPDGVSLIQAVLDLPESRRLPVISHWGIAGGDFAEPLGEALSGVDLVFLQTFSFFDPRFPDRADRVALLYQQLFPEADSIVAIKAPTGVAHAYDLVHLLARAVAKAGSPDRSAVRDALESLDHYAGLVRDYAPPFTAERHDALDRGDFRMARFANGVIMPLNRSE